MTPRRQETPPDAPGLWVRYRHAVPRQRVFHVAVLPENGELFAEWQGPLTAFHDDGDIWEGPFQAYADRAADELSEARTLLAGVSAHLDNQARWLFQAYPGHRDRADQMREWATRCRLASECRASSTGETP